MPLKRVACSYFYSFAPYLFPAGLFQKGHIIANLFPLGLDLLRDAEGSVPSYAPGDAYHCPV